MDPRLLATINRTPGSSNQELDAFLRSRRIGLAATTGAVAETITRTLADSLVRVFTTFSPMTSVAGDALMLASARSGREIELAEDLPDVVLCVGAPGTGAECIFLGADGWRAFLSRREPVPLGAEGLGASLVGHLGVLEALKSTASTWLNGPEAETSLALSLFDWSVEGRDPGPVVPNLVLNDVVWVGVGAVGHGGIAALRDMPQLQGRLALVDPDPHGSSSFRYSFMDKSWEGQPKATTLADWLRGAHPRLDAADYVTGGNEWFAEYNPDCRVATLIATPDSKETRRQLALKLPRVAINGFAESFDVGVATYRFGDDGCLACAYPIDDEALSEIAAIHNELGMPPGRVRELLDSGAALSPDDLASIQGRFGGELRSELAGKPIRSVREHLCAVGRVASPASGATAELSLGFVSAIAGVATAGELVRELMGIRTGQRWKTDLMRAVAPSAAWALKRREGCLVCADEDYREVFGAKYADFLPEDQTPRTSVGSLAGNIRMTDPESSPPGRP